ncbi:hypothetical protein F4819DRAFT_453214 [Hypoxylon fuscum]|nr:hypothetical protein F4819DRAFT_453214 [Hypoxylon fuscum]
MELQPRQSTGAATGTNFHRFPNLPIEIQLYVWELTLGDSAYIQIEWTTPHTTTIWPLASIPRLGKSDRPGLIPYVLPPGVPASLISHPPKWGFPDPQQWHGNDLYDYLESETAALSAVTSVTSNLRKDRSVGCGPPMPASFAVCGASRIQAMKHVIVDTKQPLLSINTQHTGGNRMYPVRGGFILGSVYKDQRIGRPCLVYAITPNAPLNELPPRFGQDFFPGRDTHVAARLSDIERCIFGSRLSLTKLPEGLDKEQFEGLAWMMWWRPELGHRARRPEANHPFHCPPASILHMYSMILHHLVGARVEDYPKQSACLASEKDAMYSSGDWYFKLVENGRCRWCRRPLMDDLRANFPELLDSDGCIDIVILRDRKSIEEPERTVKERSHEVLV